MFDRFRALSTTGQIVLIALGVFAITAILGAAWLYMRTPYEPVFNNLRAADAATIVADLDKRKIPYRLADGGTTILVPADVVDTTRLNVATEDLPLKGTVGFELFNKSDLGLTDFAQKINYQRALQGELERTIMMLDGVDTARVHLSLGEDHIFRDDRVPPKASVTVRMKDHEVLSEAAAQGIQRLVAAAVPKLDASDVVILDETGQIVATSSLVQSPVVAGVPSAQEKQPADLSGGPPELKLASTTDSDDGNAWIVESFFVLVPVLVVIALFVAIRRARRPHRLTEQQRTEFALKLRSVLGEGEDHVAIRP